MSQLIGVKLHQFSYELNLNTGQVISVTRKGRREVGDIPTKHRVWAAYARAVDKPPSVTFNGHTYIKMYGVVLNLNNGNRVTDGQITGQFL